MPEIIFTLLFFFALALCGSAIIFYVRIVPQSEAYVIERLGAYHTTLGTGLHFLTPVLDRVANKVSLKEQVVDFPPQPVITKDNVTMQIDTVIYYFITDPKLFTYGVDNPVLAIEKMSATTLRNIIGELELDETLTSRDTINVKVRMIIDEATDPWGIRINRVELKNIIPPRDIQEAMEKQMRAERERREQVLRAEGEKHAAILKAEGEREAALLRAEAREQQLVSEARANADSIILIAEAQAKGIKLISEANPSESYMTIKSLETLEKVADGRATKLIIPSQLQDLAGLVSSVKAIATEPEDIAKKAKTIELSEKKEEESSK